VRIKKQKSNIKYQIRTFIFFFDDFGACLSVVTNFLQFTNDGFLLTLLLLCLFVSAFRSSEVSKKNFSSTRSCHEDVELKETNRDFNLTVLYVFVFVQHAEVPLAFVVQ
jgi:hypothetical protein